MDFRQMRRRGYHSRKDVGVEEAQSGSEPLSDSESLWRLVSCSAWGVVMECQKRKAIEGLRVESVRAGSLEILEGTS